MAYAGCQFKTEQDNSSYISYSISVVWTWKVGVFEKHCYHCQICEHVGCNGEAKASATWGKEEFLTPPKRK